MGCTASATTASRTSVYVSRPRRMPPGGAPCSSRAAVLTVSPVIRVVPVAGSPTTTSPVFTPGPEPDRKAAFELEVRVEDGQRLADLGGRANGPERIVLVHLRHAEDGHHRVADELLHRSPVRLDDRPHGREVSVHDRAQRLRIHALANCRGASDVGEQDRGQPPDHALGVRLAPGGSRTSRRTSCRPGWRSHTPDT